MSLIEAKILTPLKFITWLIVNIKLLYANYLLHKH